jgi:glucan phosphoethanolaminetransferase (alkaline phosphatase superfamily)
LAVPGIGIVLGDWARRSAQLYALGTKDSLRYWAFAIFGSILWGAILHLALQYRTRWRFAALGFALLGAVFAVGAQAYTFDRYQAYLDHRAVLVGTSMLPSIGQQLWMDRMTFLRSVLPPALVVLAIALFAKKLARPEQGGRAFAMDVAVVCFFISLFGNVGEQAAPPDTLYLSAMGQLSRARWDHNETVERIHPGPRSPKPVPAIVARPPVRRNVVFVLTESVRAQSVCSGYEPKCRNTPFSNEAAPNRIPLRQMRAMDSTTAISLAIMWSGVLPTASRTELHSAPLLWEYLAAAGWHSSYWTSQNLLFGNSGTWLDGVPIDLRVSATQLEPDATMEIGSDDGKLIDWALADWSHLAEPYVAVVHLSNTHFPYKIESDFAPFLPEEEATGPGWENEIRNRYHDSIYLQDHHLARLIKAIRARPEGNRTVIVFTSDHGEQTREKGAVGHTGTVWDEEIRVPFWIDAPPGTLTASEESGLRAIENVPLFNLDVLPTLLDLVGVWDDPGLGPLKKAMAGTSLLRGGSPMDRALTLSNCTELWACAFRNWGAMKGWKKVLAHQGDHSWGCYDVMHDPEELDDLGPAACEDLIPIAEGQGRGRPF